MRRIFSLLLFSFLLSTANLLNAQVNLKNSGILYASNGTDTLYINGGFTNTSAASLTNNGKFYVIQNLTNDQASMTVGTGTLYLNGASAQTVTGSQTFKTYNLITNNSAGITLNNNLSVSGVHTFTNGIITTSATPNYLIYEAGSSFTGDADSRHVNGWVKKFGSSNFTFPIGTATIERAAGITNLSASSEINAIYRQPTTNIYNLQGPLVQVQDKEYWQIDKISGGTAQIALNWDNSKVAFPPTLVSDIKVAYYTGSLWTTEGGTATGNIATTGAITSNAINSFGSFTFGFESFPLPLNFISFTAERKTNYTRLNWTTTHEQGVDHFSVERSNDAVQFYEIAKITARNSGNAEDYLSNDYAPITNIAYYRLRSIDINGKEKLSPIISVKAENPGNLLTLMANPVHDQVLLVASSELNGVFDYRVNAINGKLMQEGRLTIQNGGQYTLSLKGNFVPGAYTLEVSNKVESFRFKLVVR